MRRQRPTQHDLTRAASRQRLGQRRVVPCFTRLSSACDWAQQLVWSHWREAISVAPSDSDAVMTISTSDVAPRQLVSELPA